MSPPAWRIQIVKHFGSEDWSNDYLTDVATLQDAVDLGNELVTFEEHIHMSAVTFDYMRVSSYVRFDRIFRHIVINATGFGAPTDYLPLFNTLRVDFATAASDPARKYYRCPVSEDVSTGGKFSTSYLSTIATALLTYLETPGLYTQLVTTAGNKVQGAIPHGDVQMRQLHRHKRKKVAPLS